MGSLCQGVVKLSSFWTNLDKEETMLSITLLSLTLVNKVISETCEAPAVDHGFVTGSGDQSRWTGRVTCDPRYILLGANHLKCLHGQWNGLAPRCVDMMGCDQGDI